MQKKSVDLTNTILNQITTGKVKMKPRWYFVVGSLLAICGLTGTIILSVFLTSLMTFSLRSHGPMGAIRYQQLVSSFPWWALGLAVVGLVFGYQTFKRFDISYKQNFGLLLIGLLTAIILSGWLIDYTGLDTVWMRQGPMRQMYLQYGGNGMIRTPGMMNGNGRRWQQN